MSAHMWSVQEKQKRRKGKKFKKKLKNEKKREKKRQRNFFRKPTIEKEIEVL